MEAIVVNEIKIKLNWKEKIVVRIFTKTIIKVYNIARITTVNQLIK
jgi:hypothetical protein